MLSFKLRTYLRRPQKKDVALYEKKPWDRNKGVITNGSLREHVIRQRLSQWSVRQRGSWYLENCSTLISYTSELRPDKSVIHPQHSQIKWKPQLISFLYAQCATIELPFADLSVKCSAIAPRATTALSGQDEKLSPVSSPRYRNLHALTHCASRYCTEDTQSGNHNVLARRIVNQLILSPTKVFSMISRLKTTVARAAHRTFSSCFLRLLISLLLAVMGFFFSL